jgi:hypothetical protein
MAAARRVRSDSRLSSDPRLSFDSAAWRRLILYATLCPFEIGGLATVVADGPNFMVTGVHIVRQDVNDIATRLDGEAVSGLLEAMIARGDDPAALRLWWHSHAREATFWSGEDEETIAGFRNDGMVSLVVNHAERSLARFDRYTPRSTTWVWVDRPDDAVEASAAERDAIRAEIADAVRYVPVDRRERVI